MTGVREYSYYVSQVPSRVRKIFDLFNSYTLGGGYGGRKRTKNEPGTNPKCVSVFEPYKDPNERGKGKKREAESGKRQAQRPGIVEICSTIPSAAALPMKQICSTVRNVEWKRQINQLCMQPASENRLADLDFNSIQCVVRTTEKRTDVALQLNHV